MTEQVPQHVVVVGQGYVGLPLAVAAAEAGHDVTGVDRDEARVHMLNAGSSPVGDVSDGRLRGVAEAGRYRAAADFGAVAQADVVVLCVPTPYKDEAPDLSYVEAAAREVAGSLRPGTLVILESTTYPGTTEEMLAPLLESGSGLRAGEDFDLVFSPERIDPGNPSFGLHNTPKIVGGISQRGTERAAAFYRAVTETVIQVSSPRAAEMTKLLENTFRHINIALVNELAVAAGDLGVDIWEVIDAAATKPFGFMPFYPGPGVGGHCIPVDPMYLSWKVRQFGGAAKFIELARDVNAGMPLHVVARIQDLLNSAGKPLNGSRVLCLGVAYKRDTPDMRESPAVAVIQALLAKGADVSYADPHVEACAVGEVEMKGVELDAAALQAADCVVVLTDHRTVDYAAVAEHAALVFDTRNVVPRAHAGVHHL